MAKSKLALWGVIMLTFILAYASAQAVERCVLAELFTNTS
jgi:hypothetical protein